MLPVEAGASIRPGRGLTARTSRATIARLAVMIGDRAYSELMRLSLQVRRAAIRCAYVGLRLYWFVARPHVSGVKCVITHGGDVLLVRHTYGNRAWDLPGGQIRRRELPVDAARREMNEEIGRRIEDWVDFGKLDSNGNHHRDTVHLFHGRLGDRRVDPDLVELDAADWFALDGLPPDLSRHVRPILSHLGPVSTP
jgi:ADP-ribose pyrophosphatase YjhB (NUDIX family)